MKLPNLSIFVVLLLLSGCRANITKHRQYWDPQKKQLAERGEWIWEENQSGENTKVQHGRWEAWDRNGRLRSRMDFRRGKLIGVAAFWHDNGQLAQRVPYDDAGRQHGVTEWWDRNGTILKASKMDHGTGTNFYFYENGNLKAVMPFVGGLADGKAIYYTEGGSIERTRDFVQGQEVTTLPKK